MDWADLLRSGQVRLNHSFTPVWDSRSTDQGNMAVEHLIDMKMVAILLLAIFLTTLLAFAIVKKF